MFRIYYTDPTDNSPCAADESNLVNALATAKLLRDQGYRMVTMVAEDINQVGLPGVSGVKDGKLPDGSDYDWTKNDRVGAAFKNK